MLRIEGVAPGSIGSELGLVPGDFLLTLNGRPVRDVIDYHHLAADEELLIEVQKADGELWDLEVEKDLHDELGLEFAPPEPTQCGNNCLFCFVHQLPKGLRHSLYVKDEDYRFSFLYGSYVTLTNIGEEQIARIIEQRLSPLYISVHATDPQLREHLLGRTAPSLLELLERLAARDIEMHTQVVLCPGLNDGAQLDRTIEELHRLYPAVRSLAVVPVGLTGYRKQLPQLTPVGPDHASRLLAQVRRHQERCLVQCGSRFVFAADEFYLKAGAELPPLKSYEDLFQLENGVGMIPLFRAEAREVLASAPDLSGAPPLATVTGESFYPELSRFAAALSRATGADLRVYAVKNAFFGGGVSVTGLLTGTDLLEQLRGSTLGAGLLLPDVLFREGDEQLLDDMTLTELERELGLPVRRIESSPRGLLEGIEEFQSRE